MARPRIRTANQRDHGAHRQNPAGGPAWPVHRWWNTSCASGHESGHDRVCVSSRQRQKMRAPPEEVSRDKRVIESYLGRSFFLLQLKGSTSLRRRSGPCGRFPSRVLRGNRLPGGRKRRGKTTTLKAISRVAPGRLPVISLRERREIHRMPVLPDWWNKGICPGAPRGGRIFPRMSVLENLQWGLT